MKMCALCGECPAQLDALGLCGNCLGGIKSYLSAIGRKGGQKSRRKLTKAQARAMVAAREKKRAELYLLKKTK